jgi:hypothetical protein
MQIDSTGAKMPDNQKLRLGSSSDLEIYHDGSNSLIEDSGTGALRIQGSQVQIKGSDSNNAALFKTGAEVELYYNNSLKFETKSDGIDVIGEVQCDSLDVDGPVNIDASKVTYDSSNGLKLADSVRLRLGAGNDLNIYHDTNNSYIKEEGDGELRLGSNNRVRITKHDSETLAVFDVDGGCELYYDNALKFQTVSNGAKVTGGLEITGDINLAGELNLMSSSDHGRIMDVRLGSSDFTIRGTSGGDVNHEKLIKFTRNGGCELYHNDNKKLEVVSGGATVTGTLTATTLEGDGVVPAGAILMWSGAQNAIPSGYVICDGNNGTPDLYNRFIVGAGSSYAVDATGGSSSITLSTSNLPGHTHSTGNHSHGVNSHAHSIANHSHNVDAHSHSTPNHSHSVSSHSHSTPNHNHNMNSHTHSTSNTGSHSHSLYFRRETSDYSNPYSSNHPMRGYVQSSGGNHNTNSAGNHSHNTNSGTSNTNASGGGNTGNSAPNTTSSGASNTGNSSPETSTAQLNNTGNATANTSAVSAGTTGSTGSGSSFDNRPPYYALCYIMKT